MDVIITCPRPKPGCRSVLPRLRPDPYPSRIAPLDLSRPPRTVHLPTEIIALIFEMINSERLYGDPDPAPATLRSCCLVASSVLGPARRALYRQIFVHVDRVRVEEKPPSNQWALLLETLAAHPYLAARVRHFELWVGYGSAHVPGYEVGLGLTGDLSTSALARSLRACRNVVSVSLVWGLWVPSNRVLKTIAVAAHNLRELSLDMYGSPSIVKKNFMNLLRSQPHLKSLHINGPVPSCDGEVPVVFALEGLAVSSVTAIDTSSFFKFVTASSHSSLRSLSLPLRESPSDIPTLARFSQLVSLTLTLKSSTSDPTFILAQLPIVPLTDLSIYNYTHSPLPALPSFPFLPPTLETLTLSNGHLPREIISFLNSDQCPLLRAFDAWDSSQTLSPFDQVALASACRRRGLELEQPAPLDGVSSEEYEERKRVDRERTVVKKMRPLESYWTRGRDGHAVYSDLWKFIRGRTPESLGFKVTEDADFASFPVPPGIDASDIEEDMAALEHDRLILDSDMWRSEAPRTEFTRLVGHLARWRQEDKELCLERRYYDHPAPLEEALTLWRNEQEEPEEVSSVPLLGMEVGFKAKSGKQVSDDWITAAVMDWWNARKFPTEHATKSHDAFVVSRRRGKLRLTHLAFPAGYLAAVANAQKHQHGPSYPFSSSLQVKTDQSRWFLFFRAEKWYKDDREGWEEVLDDRRTFVRLLLGVFQCILAGRASVPGIQDCFNELG